MEQAQDRLLVTNANTEKKSYTAQFIGEIMLVLLR